MEGGWSTRSKLKREFSFPLVSSVPLLFRPLQSLRWAAGSNAFYLLTSSTYTKWPNSTRAKKATLPESREQWPSPQKRNYLMAHSYHTGTKGVTRRKTWSKQSGDFHKHHRGVTRHIVNWAIFHHRYRLHHHLDLCWYGFNHISIKQGQVETASKYRRAIRENDMFATNRIGTLINIFRHVSREGNATRGRQ